jgi:hypothetical protein
MGIAVSAEDPADVATWASDCRRNFQGLLDMLGVSSQQVAADPFTVVPYLQAYLSELPLSQFERDDWVALHSDLATILAEYMIAKHGAQWVVRDAPRSPRGYRYVLQVNGPLTGDGIVDPFEVVAQEFRTPPIEVIRMLAAAELTAGVTRDYAG